DDHKQLHRDLDVMFFGYKVPSPKELKVELRVSQSSYDEGIDDDKLRYEDWPQGDQDPDRSSSLLSNRWPSYIKKKASRLSTLQLRDMATRILDHWVTEPSVDYKAAAATESENCKDDDS
ncbi:hypothetical protein GW17_00039147, partial [Ensete ventricosum]